MVHRHAGEPGILRALLDQTLKYWLAFYTGFLGEIGDLVDVVMIGDDLAGSAGRSSIPASIAAWSNRARRLWFSISRA